MSGRPNYGTLRDRPFADPVSQGRPLSIREKMPFHDQLDSTVTAKTAAILLVLHSGFPKRRTKMARNLVVTGSWPSHLTVPDSVLPIRALQLLEHVAQLLDLLAVQSPVALAPSLEGS